MNNIRKIIEERLDNARNDLHNTVGRGLQGELKGQIMAYQDCLNLIKQCNIPKPQLNSILRATINEAKQKLDNQHFPPDTHDCFKRIGVVLNRFELEEILPAPRTEQEILKDFEKLGYQILVNNEKELIIGFQTIKGWVGINIDKYARTYEVYEIINATRYSVSLVIQEHKLLNELFTVWGWL